MKTRHSQSLILIWRLAEFEANLQKAATIEPTHLLLGLCKSVDLDLPALVPKDSKNRDDVLEELLRETRRVRTIFRAADLDARIFRRALRQRNDGDRDSPSESQRLHRSKASRQVFASAEHLAEAGQSEVFPVHLLYAVVSSEDAARDDLLDRLGVEPARLKKVAKHEMMSPWLGEKPSGGRN